MSVASQHASQNASTNPDCAKVTRSTRKARGEGHSRRAEILAAAERIFVEVGYEGATIRRIADEVGLSSTALYMHFAEKGEILHEICRNAFEQLIENNARLEAEPGTPEQKLRRMLEAYLDFAFANPNAYRLIYLTRPIEARDGAQDVSQQLGGQLYRSFTVLVEAVAAEGRLKIDARLAAQVFWSGAHGVVALMITKPYFDWAERSALTTAMLDALFAGLLEP